MNHITRSILYDGLKIPRSAETPVTIGSLLPLTKRQRDAVRGVEIRGHGAAFYFGTYADAGWADKDIQAAGLPYYRICGAVHLDATCVGAVDDTPITGVVIEVEFNPILG